VGYEVGYDFFVTGSSKMTKNILINSMYVGLSRNIPGDPKKGDSFTTSE